MGEPTSAVKEYLVQAYVRGAAVGCAENVGLEGSTAVFTKRRLLWKTRASASLFQNSCEHCLLGLWYGVSDQKDTAMLGTELYFVGSPSITHTASKSGPR